MTRLIFKTNVDTGMLVSRSQMMSDHGLVVVTVDKTLLTYIITNFATSEVLTTGTGKNFTDLKRAAKEKLEEIGVHFDDEVRNKLNQQLKAANE